MRQQIQYLLFYFRNGAVIEHFDISKQGIKGWYFHKTLKEADSKSLYLVYGAGFSEKEDVEVRDGDDRIMDLKRYDIDLNRGEMVFKSE